MLQREVRARTEGQVIMKEGTAAIALTLSGWLLIILLIIGCLITGNVPSTMTKVPASYKRIE